MIGNERPERTATCEDCGAGIRVGRHGPLPLRCPRCRRAEQNARAAEAGRSREQASAWLQALEDDLRGLADNLLPVRADLGRTDAEASARVKAAIRARADHCLDRRLELQRRARRMRQRAYVLEEKARARRRMERDAEILRTGRLPERD